MDSSVPPSQPDYADKVEDEQLLLSRDQAELIETFRQDVRRCGTNEEKFHLCAEARGRLLEQYTQVELLIALFERAMLAECPDYRSYKRNKANAGRTGVDIEDEWDRFIGVAANGLDVIRKCLPHLKAVSVRWDREKLQHYKWPARGWLFCKRLGAVANKMAWREFIIKANQLLLRRAQMDGKFRRHRIRESPDPLDLVELENLGRWITESPYVKTKDPENVVLPFEELSVGDLPSGYGFDRYGLMVRRFCYSGGITTALSDFDRTVEKVRDARLTPEQDAGLPSPLGSENSRHARSTEPPADPCAPSLGHSRLSAPLSSPPDSPSAALLSAVDPGPALQQGAAEKVPGGDDNSDNRFSEDERCTRILRSPGTLHNVDRDTSTAALARLRPRQDKPDYREPPPRNVKQADRRSAPTAPDLPTKRCCPPKIPPELITTLDRWGASATRQILRRFMSPDVPLEEMCHIYLEKFVEVVKSPPSAETVLQVASFDRGASPRRRRASLPDLSDVSPLKRPRLSEQHTRAYSHLPATRWNKRPTIDLIRHEAYRQQVLRELAIMQHKRDSWGRRTDELVSRILHRSRPPTDEEAYFLNGEEAARRVELGSLDAPVFTEGQQRFQWPGKDRPIKQLFRYMGDLGLDRNVSVQVPSRSALNESFERKTLQEVRDRFFSQKSTNDPWNLLDLQSLLPPVLPAFLEGENSQLLLRVRDAALMGSSAERIAASGEDWSKWRNVTEWGLVSEGGHNTAPHMDSHGYSTWITVQEGHVGFGWMSRPSQQEEVEWMSRPHSYAAGKWRYVVLSAGQTVFFPSGTIHFVFRKRGVQTYAQGGHILQWSDIVRWLEVVIAQVQNENSTNEDMASSARQLVRLVKGLVANRTKAGRVEELGGRDAVARFFALEKEFGIVVATVHDSENGITL
ncbi:hypothetical protein B0T25DRAFT_536432 [Lasiosphaeria hispida]|uniref:JmjC domain-containing protein n=1 Tax=Lasiosphaeria hispida TaxID=260671 RepID=A0AAJ0MF20_9PEZI|nr:hypothetical protein B0T25DRAFT_536432 [Lasiosphaeria hispida]